MTENKKEQEAGTRACREAARACLCFNLRKTARVVTQRYDDALRPAGLKTTQFSLLVATRLAGEITMTRLADALGMDRTTLTRNLRPLEEEGLIAVAPGRDRREREVTVTAKGEARLGKALPLWRRAQAETMARLGHERAARLLGDLASAALAMGAA